MYDFPISYNCCTMDVELLFLADTLLGHMSASPYSHHVCVPENFFDKFYKYKLYLFT